MEYARKVRSFLSLGSLNLPFYKRDTRTREADKKEKFVALVKNIF